MQVTDMASFLRSVRVKLLLTRAECAKLLGVSYATLGQYENGIRRPPLQTLRRIKAFTDSKGIKMDIERLVKDV